MARPGRATRELSSSTGATSPRRSTRQEGRDRHQVVLGGKFQRAIDRAKRKAKIYTADEDVAQWRRESRPITGDLAAEAQAAPTRSKPSTATSASAARLLRRLGGRRVDDRRDRSRRPRALEELDDEDEQHRTNRRTS